MKLLLTLLFVVSCSQCPVQSPSEVAIEAQAPAAPVLVVNKPEPVVKPKPKTEVAKPEPKPAPVVVAAPVVAAPAPSMGVPDKKPESKDPKAKQDIVVRVESLKGFTPAQETRFKKIAANVSEIVNSEAFKQGVLEFTYLGKKKFIDTTDSNEKVYEKISAKVWVLEYRLEGMKNSTVGYTYPSVSWIAINKKHFNGMDDADIACNIVHEAGGHKFGRYGHAQRWSKSRDYSVPYGTGYLAERLYRAKFK